jgi:hypothetical protein
VLLQATIRNHSFVLEGDILVTKLRGDLADEDALALFTLMQDVCSQHGPFFFLVDISALGTVHPAARRTIARESAAMAKEPGVIDCRGSAIYGASLTTRAVVTLLLRAVEIFQPAHSPTRFYKTEHEARSFLDELRNR